MLITSKAIILKTLKYGETSLICEIFTELHGILTVIIGGVRKSRTRNSAGIVQPGSLVDMTIYYKKDNNMHRVKEYKAAYVFRRIPFEVPRIAVSQFMVEIIKKSVRESEKNQTLFEYCYENIYKLDQEELSVRYAAIDFALELTKHLGFYPQNNWSEKLKYFDLTNGTFRENHMGIGQSLSDQASKLLSQFISQKEDLLETNLNDSERHEILDNLLFYYQVHVEHFGKMNSPEIYHDIFYS